MASTIRWCARSAEVQRHESGAGTPTGELDATLRRWAPYARHVLESIAGNRTPNVFVYASSYAWKQAEGRRRTHGDESVLVLPPGDDPHTYRWPSLDSLVAMPGDCDGERFRGLVIALLTAGCRVIVEVRPDQAPACHYADERDALEVAA